MCISDFSNCELVTLASSLAIAMSNQLSNEDIIILSAFFMIFTIRNKMDLFAIMKKGRPSSLWWA